MAIEYCNSRDVCEGSVKRKQCTMVPFEATVYLCSALPSFTGTHGYCRSTQYLLVQRRHGSQLSSIRATPAAQAR